ncbi:MAG: 2'-5' RNA ligase family protein [Propionibacteriaceae bacterium]|nr:2'-5' RNA ligase family protein [Propionibacteriaceae bacterium]
MRSFFDHMTPWTQPDGSLHVYALPDDDVQERLDEAAARIDGVPNLPLSPASWRHFTVRRLSQFDDLKHAELSRLAQCLTDELEGLSPVDLTVGGPQLHDVAVAVEGAPNAEWDALVAAVGRAASSFGGEVLDPPYAPHLSLAYATGDVDSAEVRRRLEGAPEIGSVRLNTVHLVSVTVRPELGWFDWVELANWSL